MRRVFAELSEIVFQCVGSKESDWWSEIRCYHVNLKANHVMSAAITKFTVISINIKFVIVLNPKPLGISRTPFLVKNLQTFVSNTEKSLGL